MFRSRVRDQRKPAGRRVNPAIRAGLEESPCRRKPLTRRSLLRSAAIGSTALAATAFAKPFIHSAFSAGTLDVGLWDHWVPGGNEPWKKLAKEWGDKNHVDVNLDFITSQGDKLNHHDRGRGAGRVRA